MTLEHLFTSRSKVKLLQVKVQLQLLRKGSMTMIDHFACQIEKYYISLCNGKYVIVARPYISYMLSKLSQFMQSLMEIY